MPEGFNPFRRMEWGVRLTCPACKESYRVSLDKVPPPVVEFNCPACRRPQKGEFTPALLDALVTNMLDQVIKSHMDVEEG